MTVTAAVRWWPLVGLAALVALGLVVGKGSTPLDDWFTRTGEEHPLLGSLLFFTDGRVVFVVWAIVLTATLLRRRWRFAAVIAVTPLVGVAAARLCKRLFGRLSDGVLAYPSGHTTLAVVVLGLAAVMNVVSRFVGGGSSVFLQYGVPLAVVPLLMIFKYGKPRGYIRDLFHWYTKPRAYCALARDRKMLKAYINDEEKS